MTDGIRAELIKSIRWRSQDNLDLFPKIIAETFPTLQNVASRLIQVDTLEATEMLKIAFKIYYASIKVCEKGEDVLHLVQL